MYFGIVTNCLLIFQALCLGHLRLTAETQRSEGDVAMLFDEGFHPFSALALQVGMYWFPALVMHLLSSFFPHQGRLGCIWFSVIHVLDLALSILVSGLNVMPLFSTYFPFCPYY